MSDGAYYRFRAGPHGLVRGRAARRDGSAARFRSVDTRVGASILTVVAALAPLARGTPVRHGHHHPPTAPPRRLGLRLRRAVGQSNLRCHFCDNGMRNLYRDIPPERFRRSSSSSSPGPARPPRLGEPTSAQGARRSDRLCQGAGSLRLLQFEYTVTTDDQMRGFVEQELDELRITMSAGRGPASQPTRAEICSTRWSSAWVVWSNPRHAPEAAPAAGVRAHEAEPPGIRLRRGAR